MEPDKEVVEYMKDDVLLLVESINSSMVITHANLEAEDIYNLTVYFLGELARITGQTYNQVCEDFKEKGEE
jgi:hypothetical protein